MLQGFRKAEELGVCPLRIELDSRFSICELNDSITTSPFLQRTVESISMHLHDGSRAGIPNRGGKMRKSTNLIVRNITVTAIAAGLLTAGAAMAQQPASTAAPIPANVNSGAVQQANVSASTWQAKT